MELLTRPPSLGASPGSAVDGDQAHTARIQTCVGDGGRGVGCGLRGMGRGNGNKCYVGTARR